MTLYELQQSKIDYESKRATALYNVAQGLMTKIELLEFDIAHLNAFNAMVVLYLFTIAEDTK